MIYIQQFGQIESGPLQEAVSYALKAYRMIVYPTGDPWSISGANVERVAEKAYSYAKSQGYVLDPGEIWEAILARGYKTSDVNPFKVERVQAPQTPTPVILEPTSLPAVIQMAPPAPVSVRHVTVTMPTLPQSPFVPVPILRLPEIPYYPSTPATPAQYYEQPIIMPESPPSMVVPEVKEAGNKLAWAAGIAAVLLLG